MRENIRFQYSIPAEFQNIQNLIFLLLSTLKKDNSPNKFNQQIKSILFTKLITTLSGVRRKNTTPISFNADTKACSSKIGHNENVLTFLFSIKFYREMMLDKRYQLMNRCVIYSLVQRYDKFQVMSEILEFVRWFPAKESISIDTFSLSISLTCCSKFFNNS